MSFKTTPSLFLSGQLGVVPVLGTGTNIVNSILGDGRAPLPYGNLFWIEMFGINNLRENLSKINNPNP